GAMTTWVPDILGPGWEQATLDLGSDAEGPVVATVVRPRPDDGTGGAAGMHPGNEGGGSGLPAAWSERPAVLYLHGYNDYFFQTHLAEHLMVHGYAFYALDLRKHGRSLRPWQTPNYCTDLR